MTVIKSKVVIDEVIARQIAAIAIINPNISDISRQLNISRDLVRRVMDSAKFRDILTAVGDSSLAPAIAKVRAQTSKLVDKALKVIEDKLDEGDLDAAKVVFKIIGVDQQEDKPQDTNLTVVLPGASTTSENIIEVSNEQADSI